MRDILLVSRWFYPAGTCLLTWLAAAAIAAAIALIAVRLLPARARRLFALVAAVVSLAAAAVALAMVAVETYVFEFGSPACIVSYLALLAAFLWLAIQARSPRPVLSRVGAAFVLTAAALGYLFPFGMLPSVTRLNPDMLAGMEGTNALGNSSGTLLITEFADFECPACAMQEDAMDKLWGAFPDRIRLSFRHRPLKSLHAYARPAAIASQCAAEQNRFWETKRLLFANQNRLAELLAQPVLPTIPPAGAGRYLRCMQTNAGDDGVKKDIQQATRLRLYMTPATVVGDKLIQGVATYPRLALIVRRELAARNMLGPQQASTKAQSGCGSIIEHACAE